MTVNYRCILTLEIIGVFLLRQFTMKNYHNMGPGLNVIKLFTSVIYECVGKARSLPLSGIHFRCSTQVGSSLTHKH